MKRINITISKDTYDKLQTVSIIESETFSSMVDTILQGVFCNVDRYYRTLAAGRKLLKKQEESNEQGV